MYERRNERVTLATPPDSVAAQSTRAARFARAMRRCGAPLALALALALCGVVGARPRCRLVVIGAGTPRTGSTHEMKARRTPSARYAASGRTPSARYAASADADDTQLARLSLRDLGFGDRYDDAGYWKWHEHKQMGAAEAKKHLDGEAVRTSRPSGPQRTPQARKHHHRSAVATVAAFVAFSVEAEVIKRPCRA